MEPLSEKDLQDAAQFRDGIHKEALIKARSVCPGIESVIDRYPVESYFQQHWDYPGAWYTIVAIPEGFRSRDALIDAIVADTLEHYRRDPCRTYRKEDRMRKNADDAQPNDASVGCLKSCCSDDPFFDRLAEYPDCVIDYCIVPAGPRANRGCEAHWQALSLSCRQLLEGEEPWRYDVNRARGKRIGVDAVFAPADPDGKLNYRKAFLYPPHPSRRTDEDFDSINAVLFPNGTDGLEAYEWTTDWSAYFDDGHEWWGTLCLTVYDASLDRFVVIMASATD